MYKLLLIVLGFFLFIPTNVYAVNSSSLEGISHKQGWLVPNDYTTLMNPPNCKQREPSETEINQIVESECDNKDCEQEVRNYAGLWKSCSEIGMSVRTVDGKQVGYFDEKKSNPTNSPAPISSSISQVESTAQNSTANLPTVNQKNTSRLIQLLAAIFSLLGGLAFGKGLFISKNDAIRLGTSRWAGSTDEENLKLPQVQDRLEQRKWGVIGATLTVLGFSLQVYALFL